MAQADPLKDRIPGYPRLAEQMGLRPEMTIIRRFGALNAENLLYYQAELLELEDDLRRYQKKDSGSQNGRKSRYSLSWYWLKESREDGDTRQLDTVMKIRKTLRLYNEAIIQQFQILGYSEPSHYDIDYLQRFLQTAPMCTFRSECSDTNIWGSVEHPKSRVHDLITLKSRPEKDVFSGWVLEKALVAMFKCGCARLRRPSRVHGVIGYDDTTILKVTYWITSFIASVLPIVSISVLYCVSATSARLGLICLFNVLLTLCLIAFTNAKRPEIFAVTSAFAAVQVVFVSTVH